MSANIRKGRSLTVDKILKLSKLHFELTGSYPISRSSWLFDGDDSWGAICSALRGGRRGLNGGSSLAQVLHDAGLKFNRASRVYPSFEEITVAAEIFKKENDGKLPSRASGSFPNYLNLTWDNIDSALKRGSIESIDASSLADLFVRYLGKNKSNEVHSFEYVDRFAMNKGGKCLSSEYKNAHTKMQWECSKGHRWEATFHSIKNANTWCAECSGRKKHTIKKLEKFARDKGGKCLSSKYKNSKTKLEWQCSEGHTWWASASQVLDKKGRKGTWCLECAGGKRYTIDDMRKFAANKGGQCLSEEYKNVDTALKWMCGDGHEFERTYESMRRNGTFCTVCSSNFSEEQCRSVFEQLTDASFPTKRPAWLMGTRGKPLELDGYNESLKIAFEYNGKQHFSENTSWPSSKPKLQEIQNRDALKARLCRENNVALFQINYDDDPDLIPKIVQNQCIELKVNPKVFDFTKKIDLTTVHGNILRLNEMREIAKKRGGKCLSKVYKTTRSQLKWQCECGYVWWASPSNVKHQETWCPKCSNNLNLTIEDLKQFAKSKNGRCLSKKIKNGQDRVLWECQKGHQWKAKATAIYSGRSWCPKCNGGVSLSIDEMQSMAAEFGGKCLSTQYHNVHTDLTWECKNGHKFKQKPRNIRRYKKWCDRCKDQ